ncbi:MAG TPA: DHH family phosphoesterase [Verrucomicrobiae bacterium]|nr:DHH family phosphoesterase [Verrucomicrobiae bacterium]
MGDEQRLEATRRHVESILTWAGGRGRILIVVHDNPDPDCLASAMALRHLFVMKLNREAEIAFSGMIGRSENLAMAKELEIPLTPLDIVELSSFQVVCLLDTQPGTGNNSLPSDCVVDIVIDHHPIREKTKQCRWVDVRDNYGVTATIIYEYLLSQNVYIGSKLATALFYAIKSETQDLGREAERADREAYLRLFPLANKKLLYEITHPKLPAEYFQMLSEGLINSVVFGNVLVSNLRSVSFPEVVAEMADFFLRLEGVEVSFVMGMYSDELVLSMRTIRHDLNAGEVMKLVVDGKGVAGGHGMISGGKITAVGGAADSIMAELTLRLLGHLGKDGEEGRRLVEGPPYAIDNPALPTL